MSVMPIGIKSGSQCNPVSRTTHEAGQGIASFRIIVAVSQKEKSSASIVNSENLLMGVLLYGKGWRPRERPYREIQSEGDEGSEKEAAH